MSRPKTSPHERLRDYVKTGKPFTAMPIQHEAAVELMDEYDELWAALKDITDHFADVMRGPVISSTGVEFSHGVEGIPTIKRALIAIAKAEQE